jgi:hypothetical protein
VIEASPDVVARVVRAVRAVLGGASRPSWHDIPHPIGDPDDDEELPGDEDDEGEDEDEDDDDPLQV